MRILSPILSMIRSGGIAGIGSTFIFTIIHDIFISDIWFSAIIMMLAGIVCGVCVSWSYALLIKKMTFKSWILYNSLYVVMFMFLGLISILIFEPITTIAALIAANEPPRELFVQAIPLTIIFTIFISIIINQLYGRSWKLFGVILITSTVLVLLLGLNVSAIGLVSMPGKSVYLIIELFALIIAIDIVYAIIFILLERKRF